MNTNDRYSELEKTKLMTKAAGLGMWDMKLNHSDINNCEIVFSNDFRRLINFKDENNFPNKLKSLADNIHQDDWNRFFCALKDYASGKTAQSSFNTD